MKNFRLDDESGNQEALFSWAGYNMGRMPELEYMHHVPNGGKRDRATAVALKRQGICFSLICPLLQQSHFTNKWGIRRSYHLGSDQSAV